MWGLPALAGMAGIAAAAAGALAAIILISGYTAADVRQYAGSLWPGTARPLPVLIYHHVVPEEVGLHEKNGMVVTVEAFEEHMAWLAEKKFYTPTLAEVEDFIYGRRSLPRRSVLITFDDGYESAYEYVDPILDRYGLSAVIFIIGDKTGEAGDAAGDPFHPGVLTYLTWDQLAAMTASGRWEIGHHSFHGHDEIEGEAPYRRWDRHAIAEDLALLDRAMEDRGMAPPRSLAYPFGAYTDETVAAARDRGIALGFTVKPGCAAPGDPPLELKRLAVFPWHGRDHFENMASGAACRQAGM